MNNFGSGGLSSCCTKSGDNGSGKRGFHSVTVAPAKQLPHSSLPLSAAALQRRTRARCHTAACVVRASRSWHISMLRPRRYNAPQPAVVLLPFLCSAAVELLRRWNSSPLLALHPIPPTARLVASLRFYWTRSRRLLASGSVMRAISAAAAHHGRRAPSHRGHTTPEHLPHPFLLRRVRFESVIMIGPLFLPGTRRTRRNASSPSSSHCRARPHRRQPLLRRLCFNHQADQVAVSSWSRSLPPFNLYRAVITGPPSRRRPPWPRLRMNGARISSTDSLRVFAWV